MQYGHKDAEAIKITYVLKLWSHFSPPWEQETTGEDEEQHLRHRDTTGCCHFVTEVIYHSLIDGQHFECH